MNIVRKAFCAPPFLLLLFAPIFVKAQKRLATGLYLPEITCIDANLPITFSWVNFDDPDQDVPPVVEKKVQKIILDFYLESNGGDSSDLSKAKDYYFNTLRVPLSNWQLFIVILKTPLSYAHCKLFLYDTASNKVSKKTFDYNIWSMYNIDDNSMKRSDLYKGMRLNEDDIALVKKNGYNVLFRRVKHNSESNEIEKIVYRPNGLSLDTVSFRSSVVE